MNSSQLKAIEDNFAELVESLDEHNCSINLRAHNIITSDQYQIIESLTTSRQKRIAIIGFIKGIDCWDQFLQILRDGRQNTLADNLRKSLHRVPVMTIPSYVDTSKLMKRMYDVGLMDKILIDELLMTLRVNGTLNNSSFERLNRLKTSSEKRLEVFQFIRSTDNGWQGLYDALTKTNQVETRDLIFALINEK
jgi:hypothetical protein